MIDFKNRGSHDLEVIIYKLRNYADYLEERIKDLEKEIKDLKKEKNKKISYEDVCSSLENNYEMSYLIENYEIDEEDIVKTYLSDLINFAENSNLNENEKKISIWSNRVIFKLSIFIL